MTTQSGIAGTAAGPAGLGPLTTAAIEYAHSRGISRSTLETMGAGSDVAFFPRVLKAKAPAIQFPYFQDGRLVNVKYRSFPAKDFIFTKGGKLCFLNQDTICQAKTVYIFEGEFDAAAAIEAGLPPGQVTSVPNGARDRKADREEGDEAGEPRGYGYVAEALKAGLRKAERIVWCGDNDGAGHWLRQDMVRMLGPAKFWYVLWPEGIKDANDYLLAHGPDQLREILTKGPVPWPVEGLFRMSEIPDPPPLTLWDPGWSEWEGKVRLAPGKLSVFTGHPTHGKTSFVLQMWFQVAKRYGVRVVFASFETSEKPDQQIALRQLWAGKLLREMNPAEIRAADAWIDEHFIWVIHPQRRPTLEWILQMLEVAVVRYGACVFILDPWNRLESSRPAGVMETDYIRDCLVTLDNFAKTMNVHVMILAHPAKTDISARGKPPELQDIAGSKHWDNLPDQGFVIFRKKVFEDGKRVTTATLFHKKARGSGALGYQCTLEMDFDLSVGRYKSVDYRMPYE